MQYDDLVPERSLSVDRYYSSRPKVKPRDVSGDIGADRHRPVGIERGFGPGCDIHREPDIAAGRCGRPGVPEQERLAFRIGIVLLEATGRGIEAGACQAIAQDLVELLLERATDIVLARGADGIEFRLAFLVPEFLQGLDRRGRMNNLAEDGAVDVFREMGDQP